MADPYPHASDLCPGCHRPIAMTARPVASKEGYMHPSCYRKRGPAEYVILRERLGPVRCEVVGFVDLPRDHSFSGRLSWWASRRPMSPDQRPDPSRGAPILAALDRLRSRAGARN